MAKKKKCPECEGGEKWAVPFADFFSLLLALFIALYAIASVNKDRMRALSKSFSEIFEFTPSQVNMIPVAEDAGQEGKMNSATTKSKDESKQSQEIRQQQMETAKQLMKDLQAIKDVAPESGNGSDTEVVMTDEGIRVRVLNAIVFDEGSANLTPASKKVLDIMAKSVKGYQGNIKVEGHTSSKNPPKGSIYPSNWELSSARASAVVREFISKGFDPQKFSVVGYADTRPVSKDGESKNHFLNQRVDIVLMKYDGKNEGGTVSVLDAPPPEVSIKH
ncbi:MAG: flagellar motor protein MotB [Campylobacteraceae bacterium]|jgi:chemotaxis protein MotB|nr:flagellar motor protein MotB [Campylobacteraceae bacterium]